MIIRKFEIVENVGKISLLFKFFFIYNNVIIYLVMTLELLFYFLVGILYYR